MDDSMVVLITGCSNAFGRERVVSLLEQAVNKHDTYVADLKVAPAFREYGTDPRVQRRAGRAAIHLHSGGATMSTRPLLRLATVVAALLLASCDSLTGPGDSRGPASSVTPLPVAGDLTFVSLSAGWQHTCGLTAGGAAYCWGDNGVGQLGDGAGGEFLDHSPVPVRVAGNHTFAAIATGGGDATCGLTAEGALYCWGGTGPHCSNECATTPTPLVDAPLFVSVAVAGWQAVCGLTGVGEVYCRQPGEEGFARAALPALTSVAIGGDGESGPYPCGLTAEGEAYCGDPAGGPVPGGYRFASLSTGVGYVCGIAEGTAYCWGDDNSVGQLGRGFWYNWYTDFPSEPRDFPTPEPVVGKPALSSIAAGLNHSCALTPEGVAYCWGANGSPPTVDGRLGHSGAGRCNVVTWNGHTSSDLCSPSPTRVSGDLTFASLSAGGTHTCALTATGKAYCWGKNVVGQLGMGQSPCKRFSNGTVQCG